MPNALINGTILHYRVHGEGTPLIFIHPPLLTSANFRYQEVQLSDEFQVITFDIRGHGRSAVSKIPLTYGLIAEDVKQLLDHLDIRQAYVCGYSTGGSIALEAMLKYPDRFLGGIVISGMSELSDWYQKARVTAAVQLSRPVLVRLLALGITWGNADAGQTFRNLFRDARKGSGEQFRQYYRLSKRYNCTGLLPRIKAPVLLVYGQKDKGFHRYAKKLFRQLPKPTLIMIPNAKHQIPTKNAPELHDAIRRWIRGQQAEAVVTGERSDLQAPLIPEPEHAETDERPTLI